MKNTRLLLFLCFTVASCAGDVVTTLSETNPDEWCFDRSISWLLKSNVSHEGHYYNAVYGYSVDIPSGFIGLSDPPPSPQHGFYVILSSNPVGYVWVEGESNAHEFNSSELATATYLKWIKQSYKNATILGKQESTVGGLSATRIEVMFDCGEKNNITEEVYTAISIDESRVYRIGLVAENDVYDKCGEVLKLMLKTWKVEPLQ